MLSKLLSENSLILAECAIAERLRRIKEVELHPTLFNTPLIYGPKPAREQMTNLYREYLTIADQAGLPLLLTAPTWRLDTRRVEQAGVPSSINTDAVDYLCGVRDAFVSRSPVLVGALVGPKEDCYRADLSPETEEAEAFHLPQIEDRDLKPENLFLCKEAGEQVLKIMDFGLAASVNAARLTRTGQAMGTPIYASPEQLQGDPVDCTTDLYSVGVFIFELATGKLPWKKTDPVALTLQKFKPLPDEPVAFRGDLPPEWNQLVVDLLQGDATRRPQSVAEVRARWEKGRQGV